VENRFNPLKNTLHDTFVKRIQTIEIHAKYGSITP
jgi:hypothetical protein